MMDKNLTTQELRAIDAQCAVRLGWTQIEIVHVSTLETRTQGLKPAGVTFFPIPYYTSDENNTRLLLCEIERRGLQARYIEVLTEVVPHYAAHVEHYSAALYPGMAIWAFVRATPEQRARAFLAATE